MPESTLLVREVLFHWAAVLLYVAATVAFVGGVMFSREGPLKYGTYLAGAGLFPHAAALGMRWAAVGHGPYMARYEVLSSNAWIAVGMFLVAVWRIPRLKAAGFVVLPFAFLIMTLGLFSDPGVRRLPPSLRSVWLVLHVLFAKLGAGSILIALAASFLYLLKEKQIQSEFFQKPPALQDLDALSHRFTGFGFVFWSIMIAAGAIWADQSWGRYWGWDPVEIWSLVTWILFGLYLHLRRFFGWGGRKAAWALAVCFVFSIVSIFIVPYVATTLHGEYFR